MYDWQYSKIKWHYHTTHEPLRWDRKICLLEFHDIEALGLKSVCLKTKRCIWERCELKNLIILFLIMVWNYKWLIKPIARLGTFCYLLIPQCRPFPKQVMNFHIFIHVHILVDHDLSLTAPCIYPCRSSSFTYLSIFIRLVRHSHFLHWVKKTQRFCIWS